MSITNYWFQLIWILTAGIILTRFLPKKQEIVMGRIEERWQMAPAVLLVIPYIIAAALRSDNFGDTYAYRRVFSEAPNRLAELPFYLQGIKKDKGFSVFMVVLKSFIGNSSVCFFLIIAAIQMLCMAFIYRKYSENYWMSIFIFVNCNYYGGISIASEKKICITDSNYPVRGNVPCVSASYGTDYLYCAGESME